MKIFQKHRISDSQVLMQCDIFFSFWLFKVYFVLMADWVYKKSYVYNYFQGNKKVTILFVS